MADHLLSVSSSLLCVRTSTSFFFLQNLHKSGKRENFLGEPPSRKPNMRTQKSKNGENRQKKRWREKGMTVNQELNFIASGAIISLVGAVKTIHKRNSSCGDNEMQAGLIQRIERAALRLREYVCPGHF